MASKNQQHKSIRNLEHTFFNSGNNRNNKTRSSIDNDKPLISMTFFSRSKKVKEEKDASNTSQIGKYYYH